jgi:hypothetical protein
MEFIPTDYHWLILHEALREYCERFNGDDDFRQDFPFVHPSGRKVRGFDFDGILECYFWDLDFLSSAKELPRTREVRQRVVDLSDEAVSIAHGWLPNAKDLALVPAPEEVANDEPGDEVNDFFVAGSDIYPNPE